MWQPLSVSGGVETFISHCLNILPVEYGIQPYVLEIGPDASGLLPDFERFCQYLLRINEFDRVRTGLWTSGLGKRLAEVQIDIVVFNDWMFSDLIEPLSAHAPILMICNSHQPESGYYDAASRYSQYLRAIIGVSELITSTVKKALKPKDKLLVCEVTNGVEVPEQWEKKGCEKSSQLRLIYLGRLEQQYKRVYDIVDLARELDRLSVPAEILLVGTGPDRALLETKLAEIPLRQVTYNLLGHLNHRDALTLLGRCDILLLLSDTEGLPLSLLEAAVRGVVPVVTRLPSGANEYFTNGESAFMFDPGDMAGAASIISDLNRNRNLLRRAASSARRVAERFDLGTTLESFVRLLKQAALQTPNWKPPAYEIIGKYHDGWAKEISIVRTDGPVADIALEVIVPDWAPVPQAVDFVITNDDKIISVTSTRKGLRAALTMPMSRYNRVQLRSSNLFRPSEFSDSPDNRELSFQVLA